MNKFFKLQYFFLLLSSPLLAQSVDELDRRNGFQDIKMAEPVSNYEGLEFKKDIVDDKFPDAKLFEAKKGFYENIGNLKIYELLVKTYKDSIYEVRVVTDKDPNLYKGLKAIYGDPEYSYRSGRSQWVAKNLTLSYTSHSKNKMELVYYSHAMVSNLKEDKQQEVQEIADDF